MRKIISLTTANIVLLGLLFVLPPGPAAASSGACGVDVDCCCRKTVENTWFCCEGCTGCGSPAEKQCTSEPDCTG